MKKLVWLAVAVFVVSMLFPNGFNVSDVLKPPVIESEIAAKPDARIVKLLSRATAADKARAAGVYRGLKAVLTRDGAKRVNTTEKFEELHANTLQMAIEQPNKYPGLDEAIETLFQTAVKNAAADPGVVNAITPEIQAALVSACDVIIVSAQQ